MSKFDFIIEPLFTSYYLLVTIAISVIRSYLQLIYFDHISLLIIFACTSLVLFFNFLMSNIFFKYLKYVLPLLFFITLLFFVLFYKFKYYMFVYIICIILCTFCNFLFRVFFFETSKITKIIYAKIITFYVYTSDLVAKSAILNKN
ncbi:hypothetical protein TUBRATIS_30680 [Tubulinosema ratisbonensis]|uniref:Uncharacterized protein n=1 Tax=Tubulinosema ratisbonensis TaxID=291195 RepID=A0A437AHA0_9MICR|nr:hypothetical protein TUBRATIS_30680 [Tubulinosema ratisbonensis]